MKTSLTSLLQPYLDDLKARRKTNKEVADLLGYSPEHVSRTLAALDFKKDPRPPSERARQHALFEQRKQFRAEAATTMPPKKAASAARCSLRTIYRWRAQAQNTSKDPSC